ncbi:MAG: tyrosine-type recombinase/integrase [Chloroflexota bacterium]
MTDNQNQAILVQFEENLTAAALSASTIVNYLADLRAFLRWGETQFGDQFSLRAVTQEHIRLYRYHLSQELTRAASTVNRHLMSLRKFFTFAKDVEMIASDPCEGVALVQDNGQAISRPISQVDTEKLLLAAQSGSRAGLIRRDLAILQLLLHTGLRVSELVDLKTDDLIFNNPGVQLRVSTGADEADARYLPVSSQVCKDLNDYLAYRPRASQTTHFFLNQRGEAISGRTIQRVISDCTKTAGLEGVSAQSLRRTFALNLLAETNDLALVSERLGHQSKTITAQYLAVHDDK